MTAALLARDAAADVETALDRVAAATSFRPFAAEITSFVADLAGAIQRHPRLKRQPEAVSLAYWLRKGETARLAQRFAALETDEALRVPAGLAFHIPPGNVDTMFVYSWILSVLVGNRNIVRLSARRSAVSEALLEAIAAAMVRHPAIAAGTAFLSYGHDDRVTAAISSVCDLRVIWGGDETIRRIRAVPLAPQARELIFADRFSFAALAAGPFLALDEARRRDTVRRLFNDIFWFNQMACASTRLVVWCGAPAERAAAMAAMAAALRAETARQGYRVEAGVALGKLAFAFGAAIDLPVAHLDVADLSCVLIDLAAEPGAALPRESAGGGTLFQLGLDTLAELAPRIIRKDQTMTHFGFSREELGAFARRLNGRGIDRMVPLGAALQFSHIWDGYDLLEGLTRTIAVVP